MDIIIKETKWDKIKRFFIEEMNTRRLVLIVLAIVFIIKNLFYHEEEENQDPNKYKSTPQQDQYLKNKYFDYSIGLIFLFVVFGVLKFLNYRHDQKILNKSKEEKIKKE